MKMINQDIKKSKQRLSKKMKNKGLKLYDQIEFDLGGKWIGWDFIPDEPVTTKNKEV